MSPLEITLVTNNSSGSDHPGPLRPRPRFPRLKMALAALLIGSIVMVLLVAAFMIGTIVAIVSLGFLTIAAAVIFIRRLFGRMPTNRNF